MSIAERYCAETVVFALDLILEDAKEGLPLDSYQGLWDMEQKYRTQYGIVGTVGGGEGGSAPIPQTPSEIAAARTKAQADYELGQAWQQAVLLAITAVAESRANRDGPSPGFIGAPLLGPTRPNAYGPGINSDATGRPFVWRADDGSPAFGTVRPNVYGPGIASDSTGRPVRATPLW